MQYEKSRQKLPAFFRYVYRLRWLIVFVLGVVPCRERLSVAASPCLPSLSLRLRLCAQRMVDCHVLQTFMIYLIRRIRAINMMSP